MLILTKKDEGEGEEEGEGLPNLPPPGIPLTSLYR